MNQFPTYKYRTDTKGHPARNAIVPRVRLWTQIQTFKKIPHHDCGDRIDPRVQAKHRCSEKPRHQVLKSQGQVKKAMK
jgi:hypothetical protein